MIGEVMTKEVDFAAAGFSVTSARQKVVDFASAFFRESTIIAMKMPEPESRIWLYLQLYQPLVWFTVFGVVVGTSMIFWIINNVSRVYDDFADASAVVTELRRFGYSIIYFSFTIISEGELTLSRFKSVFLKPKFENICFRW